MEINEKILKAMVMKLLSIMNPEQLEEINAWLAEMNLKIEDINGQN